MTTETPSIVAAIVPGGSLFGWFVNTAAISQTTS